MTERNSGSIGGIGRRQTFRQTEKGLDHLTDLVLAGRAVPGNGLLDLVGRVLGDVALGRNRFGHDDPASHPDPHRSTDILLEQDALDRHHMRSEVGDQRANLALEFGEALRQIDPWIRSDHTRGNSTRRTPMFDEAVAASRKTWVDPKNEHMYDPIRPSRIGGGSR